jgi:methyl-accepting chemotaxis protein
MSPGVDIDGFIDKHGTDASGTKIGKAFHGDNDYLVADEKEHVRDLLKDVEAERTLDVDLDVGESLADDAVDSVKGATSGVKKVAEGAGDAAKDVGDLAEDMRDAADMADDVGDAMEDAGDIVEGMEDAGKKGAKGIGSLGKAFGGAVKSAGAFLAANPAIIASIGAIAAVAAVAYAAWYYSAE